MNRLKNFIKGIDTSIKQLRVEGEFQTKFLNIVKLAKSPFVQLMLANFNVDPKILDTVFNGLLYDKQVSDIVETIANIFECFSVNRFIGVQSEKELEDVAIKLNQKRLFYAGVYFGNNGYDKNKEFSYKIRMDADNTPITLENRNRFWFPGPNGNFELNMRYHRGFIQLQHMIDQAITKTVVEAENDILEEEWLRTTTTTETPTTTESGETEESTEQEIEDEDDTDVSTDKIETDNIKISTKSESDDDVESNTGSTLVKEGIKSNGSIETTSEPAESSDGAELSLDTSEIGLVRKKRQFDFFNSLLGQSDKAEGPKFQGIEYGNMQTFTKQFPYPKYRRDDFLTGLYLAQCIQLTFFFALIVQVTNAVRNRIWMRESGNSTVRFKSNLAHVIGISSSISFVYIHHYLVSNNILFSYYS